MEENNEALNEQGEENIPTESPAEEQIPEETPDQKVEEASEAQEESVETEGEQGKGSQARIRELVRERNEERERAKSLEQRVSELTGPVGQRGYEPPQIPELSNEPIVSPGEEIDASELDRRIRSREQRLIQQTHAMIDLKQKQSEAVNRISNEVQSVIKLHPELDPDSESFDPDLSDAVSEATESYIKSNPYSASVVSYVNKLMRPYKGAVTRGVGKATEVIAKQVSSTALRPTSIRQPEKTAQEKSIAELEKELGVIQA